MHRASPVPSFLRCFHRLMAWIHGQGSWASTAGLWMDSSTSWSISELILLSIDTIESMARLQFVNFEATLVEALSRGMPWTLNPPVCWSSFLLRDNLCSLCVQHRRRKRLAGCSPAFASTANGELRSFSPARISAKKIGRLTSNGDQPLAGDYPI